MSALTQDDETDYTLNSEYKSCWITVDGLSIYIVRQEGGVKVHVFPKGYEADDPLTSTFTADDQAIKEEP